ncbi:MAG TPA: hypothetical protein VIL26_00425 [Clostridia bacterium]
MDNFDDNNKSNNRGSKRESLKTGIAKVITGIFVMGVCVLVCFLSFYKQGFSILLVFFLIPVAILFLIAFYLMIQGIMDITYNLILIKKKRPFENTDRSKIFINTNPIAGLLGFLLAIIFFLIIIYDMYPDYKAGETDFIEIIVFLILSGFSFIYSIYVFLYNLIKRK